MWRTGRLRQSRLHSTGRRICNTMRYPQRATTILRNLSCILPGSLLGKHNSIILLFYCSMWILCMKLDVDYCFYNLGTLPSTLWSLLLLLLLKYKLTWLHSNSKNYLLCHLLILRRIFCTLLGLVVLSTSSVE